MSIKPTAIKAKIVQHERLAADVDEFLKRGGQIQQCDHTSNATYKPRAFSLSETRKCRNGLRESSH